MTTAPSPLITAAELADRLASGHPPVLLDVRWTLAGADPAAHRAGHLPGALFVDLDAELAGAPGAGGRHPLPDPVALQAVWRRLGIDDDSAVVVYDGADGAPAARAWWLLRWSGLTDVRVLDGGLGAWTAGLVGGEEMAAVPGSVTVRPGSMPTVDIDGAADLAATGMLLDARAAARYRGEVEPIDPAAGHIPGAVNLPYASLIGPDGTMRPAAELRAAFAAAGVDGSTPAGASCGSGVTACHLVLAAAVAGVQLALYPGSWSQWCAAGRPVATG
ncbi:sulfurtransferase [Nakamurella flavida]|uniref:Sulfurtransferase n=1 Tax=Nakamurella flavida TaxID=363630 RepID=A0A938YQP9_9ACTN|nr:sulfurtransferase [Nakamurella flavida]MBM9477488.1 sulfurtransferase [Nakamurella flavida]MDP9777421.1 thiosulfate/3-mercaptopyruvate sulfurtransferase [Nakamurella flavida]